MPAIAAGDGLWTIARRIARSSMAGLRFACRYFF
jgi:hypothetical protein